jgi:hypothetical protein
MEVEDCKLASENVPHQRFCGGGYIGRNQERLQALEQIILSIRGWKEVVLQTTF